MAEEIVPQPFGDRVGHVLAFLHSCFFQARELVILQKNGVGAPGIRPPF
jgi:hypothetical protein